MLELATDPHQLESIESTADKELVERLAARLIELRACRGERCRELG